jgi:protein-L-isoaspartate(D-aspartate) O-methyltransferase
MDFEAGRARLVSSLSRDIGDARVLEAISRVPREFFIPEKLHNQAYDDHPLPIGYEQTISQPYIVALMTQALELTGSEKVLEIGTGSGYQAAILAELAGKVITIERLIPLVEQSTQKLTALGYKNIIVHPSLENLGWPGSAPYDAIMVTAGAPRVPQELLDQLAIGGRLVVPVGPSQGQRIYKITRLENGLKSESLGGCRFVHLIGKGAW